VKKKDMKVGMILKSQMSIDKNCPYYLILTIGELGFTALTSSRPDHFWVSIHHQEVLGHGHHCWWDARYLKEIV